MKAAVCGMVFAFTCSLLISNQRWN